MVKRAPSFVAQSIPERARLLRNAIHALASRILGGFNLLAAFAAEDADETAYPLVPAHLAIHVGQQVDQLFSG
jgi:hypothetical protein